MRKFIRKQFAVLAFCLTVTMTNNAYSMGPEEITQLRRRLGHQPHVENQSQERDRVTVTHAAPPFR